LFALALGADDVVAAKSYQFEFAHSASGASTYLSPASQVIEAPDTTDNADTVTVEAKSLVDTNTSAYSTTHYPVAARSGVSALTYVAQITEDTGDTDVDQSNVPVMAIITAGTNWKLGETLSVTGTGETISRASATMIVTSLTDDDGQWEFTVTSSDSSSASAVYSVDVFMLKEDGAWATLEVAAASNAALIVDYATAGADTLTTPSNVVAASSVSLTFTIEDAFGEAIAADALGRQYSVQLTSPDTDDIDLDVVATDGTATFVFDNYLTAGESEILTAKVYRGSATSPTLVSVDTTVTLFAVTDVTGVNVTKNIAGVVVSYADFITGKTSAAAPGPTGGTTYTGTVVDANGAGIPGAVVTIAADGFQFKSGDLFYNDSVTLASTSAGTFSVTFWTHTASATGENITVTAGGKSATTLVKSVIPSGDGSTNVANLKFSWDLPANVVMNTTYAVTATLTDKWNNPLSGADLSFTAFAAATFNGVATAVPKTTDKNGQATVYLRSLKDIDGISAVGVTFTDYDVAGSTATDLTTGAGVVPTTNVATTAWDETSWSNSLESPITFLKSSAGLPVSGQKVNAGSFKGYVALYAKGYEGQRMSAKVGNDWVIVPAIPAATNDLFRAVEFVGAGVEISVRLYIDRVLVATIPLLTK
jgi:hypothetical protein